MELSTKDKRYLQSVDRALQTFDTLNEWADYIAFLSRLQKALSLDPHSKTTWIPNDLEISNKLSLCLTPNLPNGVHQKALSLYELIFGCLTTDVFNKNLKVWLPGLLPVLSFGSIQVKSQIIKIFNTLIQDTSVSNLKLITKPLILSFLSGLDDENSESFNDIFKLLDLLKNKLSNDHHFWQNFFLAIISNPERRLGALYWCNKRLPVFVTIKTDNGLQFSEEAQSCLSPSPGLLIRSFASAINTETVFNSANDIIIIRGFFDLMLSHLPLNSGVLASYPKDKSLLMDACLKVLLKKDMSLNRRLWNWLLGPDPETHDGNLRAEYFKEHGLDTLKQVLLELIDKDVEHQINGFKMALSLIIDKWEISHLLVPHILKPILTKCFETYQKNGPRSSELLASCQNFFNGVESSYIWSSLISYLIQNEDLKILEFVLTNFDFNDEEMKLIHVPLALLISLISLMDSEVNDNWINITSVLTDLISPKAFEDTTSEPSAVDISQTVGEDAIVSKIKEFYKDPEEPPFTKSQLNNLIYNSFKKVLIKNLGDPKVSGKLCDLFTTFIYMLPLQILEDEEILDIVLKYPLTTKESNEVEQYNNLVISFSLSKLFNIYKTIKVSDKMKIIKIITTNMFPALIYSNPKFYQVEAVKCFFELSSTYPHYMEAAISGLILNASHNDRLRAITSLWSHSSSNESDLILMRPLQLILDDLFGEGFNSIGVTNFIKNILVSGHSNRLLKMITNPLLDFEFMQLEVEEIDIHDELSKFAYHLKTIINVINSNNKALKETFNNEFAVMDNSAKLKIIRANEWDISTYKSLIFYTIEKFLSLKISEDLLSNDSALQDYYSCIDNCLELFNTLITGNEQDFNDKFHGLIDNCSYFISFDKVPYQIELIQTKYLKSIFHLLKLSEDSRINLNLLHIEDESREPLLVKFIIHGIEKSHTSVLLEEWMKLLTRSLYLFNESVFSVLSTLNTSIISKIDSYFHEIKDPKLLYNHDIELSINALISGIEDLLSISHSYLLTSKIRNKSDMKNGNNDSFLGNVIQGVFSIESPAVRTTEQNKLYAILLAFQEATSIGFKLWEWSDSKKSLDESDSTNHLANKLKFRSKKLLESLMDLERQEIIENLIAIDESKVFSTSIKLLNVLDGGRSQITLPHIFNSIVTRCYPNILDDNKKSHLNVNISERELSRFLIYYFQSIDNDTITDIWNFTMQFFKDVLSHFAHFKPLVSYFLKIITMISCKLSNKPDNKKSNKELSDLFVKILTASVSGKRILFSSNGEEEKEEKLSEDEEKSTTPAPSGVNEELIDTIIDITPSIEDVLQDQDRISSFVNLIIFNLISVQIKNKKINDIPIRILNLIINLGQLNANKSWKVLVQDLFNDGNFFNNFPPSRFEIWSKILSIWISIDQDKFSELISKVSIQSSSGTLFSWNEKSEVEIKIYSVKRLSMLILSSPKDYFLSHLEDIFNKIENSLNNSCPLSFKSEITILFRILILKFSEMHLLPYWSFINQQLISIFNHLISKNIKELSIMTPDELNLVLKGSKLLDQLLILQNDEFNLNEWLFVKHNADVNNVDETVVALIDKISSSYDLTVFKELPVNLSTNDDKLIPLLKDIKTITSISQLRTFFESLSYLNYERVYSLKPVDFDICQSDIINDLI